jgi:hypothetical protein
VIYDTLDVSSQPGNYPETGFEEIGTQAGCSSSRLPGTGLLENVEGSIASDDLNPKFQQAPQ